MRIALVTAHFPPHFLGGTERVVLAQAQELRRRGLDVRVVSGTDRPWDGKDVLRESAQGIPVAFLPRREDEITESQQGRERLRPILHRELAGADLVHVHGTSTLTDTLVRDSARQGPVVYSIHDHFPTCPRFFRWRTDEQPCPELPAEAECAACVAPQLGIDGPDALDGSLALEHLAGALRRRLRSSQQEVDAASLVTVPSFAHRLALGRHLNLRGKRLAVIPPGLCLQLPGRYPRPRPWFGAGPLRVLHFGNLSEAKGTLDLVRALSELPPRSVHLTLVGRGLDLDLSRRIRELGPDLDLDVHGAYDGPALEKVAAPCHLAAFPSRLEESYGLVIDEAMALGLPAWVSDRGAPQDRIGRAGRVLPGADPAAWGVAFRGVLADSTPGQGELATEWAAVPKETFGAADVAEEWLSAYEDLLLPARRGLTG
jgi:glycosyltransferase involved in cell wall biosynthesis